MAEKNASETKMDWDKKYDVALEQAVFRWIAGVLEDATLFDGVSGPNQFKDKLKNGEILCNLMNKLQAGIIKKFKKNAKMPFQQMENIGFVNEAMRNYGVQAEYIFVTVDLFEGQNIPQVLLSLRNLGDVATGKGIKPAFSL
ncbi:myophilin-like [Clytia hemisphaerica]|uniref:Calponin-homology (CH) domain-containing protein n=1 Tax=Clytia hemisphaerica TaxID=252671 RepID=A0A7M5XDQ3_9CNID